MDNDLPPRMNWHTRYIQQAKWTRALRNYILDKIKPESGHRVLEVGCGTGAILSELPTHLSIHGLDLDLASLEQCRSYVPQAWLFQGDALSLPCADLSFDVVYCHYLLLWVNDPLQALREMKRVTKPGGNVIAFAEPDYSRRIDKPDELASLGGWQTDSLKHQGANPEFGAHLAESFFQAGIQIIEAGLIQGSGTEAAIDDWEIEWAVIESDLAGWVSDADIQEIRLADKAARERGERVLHVPTYFAWGCA